MSQAPPDVDRALRIWKAAVFIPLLLISLALYLYSGFRNEVVFDNASAFALNVAVNGAAPINVPAGSHVSLPVDNGTYRFTARGPTGVFDEGAFVVARSGSERFRGVYNLGGVGRYGLVTVHYAYGRAPVVAPAVPLGDGGRFFALPSGVDRWSQLDGSFPRSPALNGGATTITYVCHVAADGAPGCRLKGPR